MFRQHLALLDKKYKKAQDVQNTKSLKVSLFSRRYSRIKILVKVIRRLSSFPKNKSSAKKVKSIFLSLNRVQFSIHFVVCDELKQKKKLHQ